MNYDRDSYMRAQEAEHDMIRMRQPIQQFGTHPDPRDEIIADLVDALENILKVQVKGWENIWAGSGRCQEIARVGITKARGKTTHDQ